MQFIGLSGSLREHSFNSALIRLAAQLLPEHCSVEIYSCDLPLYNADLEAGGLPVAVKKLKQAIAGADGVIIATPEYNHGIAGVLKNAVDWASRPAFESPLKDKPVAILSASMSPLGGARAQTQLRSVMESILCRIYPREFLLGTAHEVFDQEGQVRKPETAERLERFLGGYLSWMGG